eukprot:644696-Hanusia_phi.AAC.2
MQCMMSLEPLSLLLSPGAPPGPRRGADSNYLPRPSDSRNGLLINRHGPGPSMSDSFGSDSGSRSHCCPGRLAAPLPLPLPGRGLLSLPGWSAPGGRRPGPAAAAIPGTAGRRCSAARLRALQVTFTLCTPRSP